ncbi:hypothetical protein Ciccas_004996 [Cichlidogyrus casuarinus]|uniref:Cadherin domain-containing protein n=1 Tax=Cichlidogyrus casuarinus TaxID=1844966 RepID=A0ABD2QC86_9PLAT
MIYYLVLCLTCIYLGQCFKLEASFYIEDYKPAHQLVGDIARQTTNFPYPNLRLDQTQSPTKMDTDVNIISSESSDDDLDFIKRIITVNWAGEIFTLEDIDRDNRTGFCGPLKCCTELACQFSFIARFFRKSRQEKVDVHVQVHVIDKNDNEPRFPENRLDLEVTEHFGDNRAHSWNALLPNAVDLDSDMNGIKKYELKGFSSRLNYFTIDSDNAIMLLDYEDPKVPHQFELVLHAVDGGLPPKTGTLAIGIKLIDKDDNPPTFNPLINYQVEIKENTEYSQPIFTFIAADIDEDGQQKISYKLECERNTSTLISKFCHYFKVDPSSGELFLLNPIDFEQTDSGHIPLEVSARSGKGMNYFSTRVTLHVIVQDLNDNAPIIEILNQTAIPENIVPDMPVMTMQVRDKDSVSVGKILCKLTTAWSEKFELKRNFHESGIIYELFTSYHFDRELTAQVELLITCYDNAQQGKQTSTKVSIQVKDENDNKPEFIAPKGKKLSLNLPEDTALAKSLFEFKAKDPDAADNGRVIYQICCDILPFTIDAASGVLSLQNNLDYESKRFYSFQVIARDDPRKEDERLSSTVDVSITVTDVNDNPPQLVMPMTRRVSFSENQVGHLVDLHFSDPDKGGGGTFFLQLAEEFNDYFMLLENGSLFVTSPLDREESSVRKVVIIAKDYGQPVSLSSTTTIEVELLDEDDCEPTLVNPVNGSSITYQPIISDNPSQDVTSLLVVDWDSKEFSRFNLVQLEQENSLFTISKDARKILLKPHPDQLTTHINSNYPPKGSQIFKFQAISMPKEIVHNFAFTIMIKEPKDQKQLEEETGLISDAPKTNQSEQKSSTSNDSISVWNVLKNIFQDRNRNSKQSMAYLGALILAVILVIAFVCIGIALVVWFFDRKNKVQNRSKPEVLEDPVREIDPELASFYNFYANSSKNATSSSPVATYSIYPAKSESMVIPYSSATTSLLAQKQLDTSSMTQSYCLPFGPCVNVDPASVIQSEIIQNQANTYLLPTTNAALPVLLSSEPMLFLSENEQSDQKFTQFFISSAIPDNLELYADHKKHDADTTSPNTTTTDDAASGQSSSLLFNLNTRLTSPKLS